MCILMCMFTENKDNNKNTKKCILKLAMLRKFFRCHFISLYWNFSKLKNPLKDLDVRVEDHFFAMKQNCHVRVKVM